MTSRKFNHDTGGGGGGQIGRARHSVSLRNGDSPSRTISGGALGEERRGEKREEGSELLGTRNKFVYGR